MAKLDSKKYREVRDDLSTITYILTKHMENDPDYLTMAIDASSRIHKALLDLRPKG